MEKATALIPRFPEFSRLSLAHKKEIEGYTRIFPPYSDYTFASLWCWDVLERYEVSELNGDLVVKFSDYLSNAPFFSILGEHKIGETIESVFSLARETMCRPYLKLIPEHSLRQVGPIHGYEIVEDFDNHDYVYSVEQLAALSGRRYQTHRNFINQFRRKYLDFRVASLDLSRGDTWQEVEELCQTWALWKLQKGGHVTNDIAALRRLATIADRVNLISLGLYVSGKLSAYSITELNHSGFATNLFEHADVTYLTLQQMLVMGIDIKHGFHLEMVPFLLNDENNYSEEQRADAIRNGDWDCLITLMESIALAGDYGVITAINDESTGAEQIWAGPDINSIGELQDLRITYPEGNTLTMDFMLGLAGLSVRTSYAPLPSSRVPTSCSPIGHVVPVPAHDIGEAIAVFNRGGADAIFGWTPDIEAAARTGGHMLINDESVRVSVSVIVTSRESIDLRPDLVQAFHDAWFEALKAQFENPRQAADAIANWGHNEWTGISVGNAYSDFSSYMEQAAQAALDANYLVMTNADIIPGLLEYQQQVLTMGGQEVTVFDLEAAVDPRFVLASWSKPDLHTNSRPLNPTFHLGQPKPPFDAARQLETVAELPFEFGPDSTALSEEAQDRLTYCIAPIIILFGTPDLALKIIGSAAWPSGYTEQEIRDFALRRAQTVQLFLVSLGLSESYLLTEAVVPSGICPQADCPEDRYVRLILVSAPGGR